MNLKQALKHTDGPWGVEFSNCGEFDPRCKGGWRVTGPHHSEPHGYENEADARAMSAAPDLLAALKAIQEFCDDPNGSERGESLGAGLARLLPAARAAIAKAEGRS